MQAVEALCRDIVARWRIPAHRVVGHSDIAPTRKSDPGELFDWPRLARAGIGARSFSLARAGKPVELKPSTIRISSLEIAALEDSEAHFTMSISAGGYVRSVARELGQDLGCGAHLSSLRRTQAGVFSLAEDLTGTQPRCPVRGR